MSLPSKPAGRASSQVAGERPAGDDGRQDQLTPVVDPQGLLRLQRWPRLWLLIGAVGVWVAGVAWGDYGRARILGNIVAVVGAASAIVLIGFAYRRWNLGLRRR